MRLKRRCLRRRAEGEETHREEAERHRSWNWLLFSRLIHLLISELRPFVSGSLCAPSGLVVPRTVTHSLSSHHCEGAEPWGDKIHFETFRPHVFPWRLTETLDPVTHLEVLLWKYWTGYCRSAASCYRTWSFPLNESINPQQRICTLEGDQDLLSKTQIPFCTLLIKLCWLNCAACTRYSYLVVWGYFGFNDVIISLAWRWWSIRVLCTPSPRDELTATRWSGTDLDSSGRLIITHILHSLMRDSTDVRSVMVSVM